MYGSRIRGRTWRQLLIPCRRVEPTYDLFDHKSAYRGSTIRGGCAASRWPVFQAVLLHQSSRKQSSPIKPISYANIRLSMAEYSAKVGRESCFMWLPSSPSAKTIARQPHHSEQVTLRRSQVAAHQSHHYSEQVTLWPRRFCCRGQSLTSGSIIKFSEDILHRFSGNDKMFVHSKARYPEELRLHSDP